MTYEVNFTDPGKLPIVIPSRTINDTATDVALYGFTTLEYGEPLDEAFLHLLENYSSPAKGLGVGDFDEPSSDPLLNRFIRAPIEGQYWFNKTRNALFVFHSGSWHEIMMGSHVAANWGVVTNGQSIPRPISRFGYVFPYTECSWSIAPRAFTAEPEWFVCLTDLNGVVNSRVRYVGEVDLVPLEANYLILGVRHNANIGTVRTAPCAPASVSIQRRLPTNLTTSTVTTGTVSIDLEAIPGAGTQGPVSYQWELSGVGTDWVFTTSSSLTDKRIIGTLTKANVSTAGVQTCTIKVTMTDACSQEVESQVVVNTTFTVAALPNPTVTNCGRTINVTLDPGDEAIRVNTLSVSRPSGATWFVDWDTAGITDTCSDVTHTVTLDTETDLTLSFAIDGTVDSTCTYTIPYRIKDSVTLAESSVYTCTITIVRDVNDVVVGDVDVVYPCTIGTQIGDAGGIAVAVATETATSSGGVAPYAYSFDTGAPGAGFDDSDCTGDGVTISSVSINSSNGRVSFNAQPPVSGTGECTIAMSTLSTDSTADTGVVAHDQVLRWGTPAPTYVGSVTATCPAAITLNSSGALIGTRSAVVTIPVSVFDNLGATMTSGAEVELGIANGCGSDVSITAFPSVTTITSAVTNMSFTVAVPQNSSFTCSSLVVTVIARNTDESWSSCEYTTTCTVTITAENVVITPLTLTYRSDLSTALASCEACDTTACGPTATIVVDVSGGTGPYSLLPQTSSSTAGTGYTLSGITCAGAQHTVVTSISGSRVTATIKMVDGLTAQNCDGNIEIKVRDAVGTNQTITRGFSLVRTVCPAPCFDVVPFNAGGSHFCLGFYASTTTPSTSCAGNGVTSTTPTVFMPGITSSTVPTSGGCASLNAVSHSAAIQAPNRVTIDGATRWWPRPAAKLSIKIVVPGVGETPLEAIVFRPSNYAAANGTSTQSFPVTVGARSFTVTLSLTVNYVGTTTIGGDCNNILRYTASASYTISPTMGSCTTYTDPTTTTTSGGGGGGGPPACFTKDMTVIRGNGSRAKMGSIVPGDVLRTYNVPGMADESTEDWRDWSTTSVAGGSYQNVTVKSVKNHVRDHYYYVNEMIKVTGEHPILIQRDGVWSWVNAEYVRVGDVMFGASRNMIPVTGVRYVPSPGLEVVQIDVEHVDSYFAGSPMGIAVLVHNKLDVDNELIEN